MDHPKSFPTGHEELIHCIAYDFYGHQLATCSSDQHVKVFDHDTITNSWSLNDSWKAHDSTVSKVAFASPEFGRMVASISYDCTIKLWQETSEEQPGSGRRWKKLAGIKDSHGPLYDMAFCPPHLGLKLGAIGSDGILRIYECMDPSSLSAWNATSEISVLETPAAASLQSDFCISWCKNRFKREKLCCCALDQGFIYCKDKEEKFILQAALPEHNGLIRSVDWAASMGRSYELLATGCKDGFVRIFKVSDASEDLEIDVIFQQDLGIGEIWRVKWNITGTILSTAGDDGKIRLWKATFNNRFQCMSIVSID